MESEERGEQSLPTHTGDWIYILYNIQPFYGSPTFMAHYDYEWSLTPQRAKSCDTERLLLDVLFFLLPWAMVSFVARYSGWWEGDNWAHGAQLWLVRAWPRPRSELRTVLQPICLLLTKIAYRYSQGRGTGPALDKCNKERLCNYKLLCCDGHLVISRHFRN